MVPPGRSAGPGGPPAAEHRPQVPLGVDAALDVAVAEPAQQRLQHLRLVAAELQQQRAAWAQQRQRLGCHPAQHLGAVGPAVESRTRLVGHHVAWQQVQLPGGDVGSHRRHHVDGAGQRRRQGSGEVPADGVDEQTLLRLAAAAEDPSEHPIARAIAGHGRGRLGTLPAAESFSARAGLGVEAVVEDHAVVLGRPSFLADWGVHLPSHLAAEAARLESDGATVVAVAWDGEPRGLVAVADRVKASSRRAVAALRDLGLTPVLLTGDNERTARAVAAEVGIDRVLANVLPQDKAAEVARLQAAGEVVAMVGDGVNDAPALARADLGLSIGTGADVAIEASDLTLVAGDLRAAADAIRLSRRTLRTIRGNLVWAFGYNVAAIPLAVAGLVNPIIAAAAMAFSSVFVVTNSLRLRRFHPTEEAR